MAVPLFIVSGYLGAGKTTLIREVLPRLSGRSAVVVNDFGPVGLDGKVLEGQGVVGVVQEIPGGCLCCTVQDQLPQAIHEVLKTGVDRVIVEPSGVARPGPLRDQLLSDELALPVTPVNVVTLLNVAGWETPVTPLLREQMEAADVLTLTHGEHATEAQQAAVLQTLAGLYPPKPLVPFATLCQGAWFAAPQPFPEAPLVGEYTPARDQPPQAHDHVHGEGVEGHVADGMVWPGEPLFDFHRLYTTFLSFAEGNLTHGCPVRAKGVFRTGAGFVLVELVGRQVMDRPIGWRGESQCDAVLLHPTTGDFEQVWVALEGCIA